MTFETSKLLDFIDPKNILLELGLKDGDTVIDYASGAGHWSIRAAKLVAPRGRVLALENDIDMLNMIKGRADLDKITNLEIEEINLEKGKSKKAKPADLVIVSNILYLINNKESFVKKAAELVKENGKLLLVEFVPRKTIVGPPVEMRLSEEDVIRLFEKAGLHFACTVNAGWHHYGLIFDHKGAGCDWKK